MHLQHNLHSSLHLRTGLMLESQTGLTTSVHVVRSVHVVSGIRPCTFCWRPVPAGRVACMCAEICTATVQTPDAKNCITWRCGHSAHLPGSNVLIVSHGAPAESIGCNRAGVSNLERRTVCGINTGADSCAGYGSVRRNWGSSHCWRPGMMLLLIATTQVHTVWTCVMPSRFSC